ncbi:MAG: DUF4388 domain-containing protein [Acidimicrobiales bacterium]|nr:DUF4388 domain-containing protein [Acidimicrobiales bacterium]
MPEVLRMLGSGAKTGRLRLSGDRGSGSVWIDGGKVVGAEATGARDAAAAVAVLFELLRYGEGSFSFEADETTTQPGNPQDIEVLLGEAERQLEEWREIEAVVPSLAVGLALVPDLPTSEVVVDRVRWKAIVAVAEGRSVAAVADALELDELDACRRAKDLVEAGLVEVVELEEVLAPEPAVPETLPGPTLDDAPATDPWAEPVAVAGPGHDAAPGADLPYAADEPGQGDLSAADAAYTAAAEPYATEPYASDPYATDPYAPANGYGAPSSESAASSARAELDAMASGFGLADAAPEAPAYESHYGEDTGSGLAQGFGSDGGGGFDQGFASDPSEDPAFSFAAPDAGGDFAGFGSFDSAPAEPLDSPMPMGGAGAALFADDLPSGGGSDALFSPGTSGFEADDTGDAAEVARQLANLSPKAARAVAAAARATTVEEREAALAEVTSEGDEPINRGLLLKFLSSVQT